MRNLIKSPATTSQEHTTMSDCKSLIGSHGNVRSMDPGNAQADNHQGRVRGYRKKLHMDRIKTRNMVIIFETIYYSPHGAINHKKTLLYYLINHGKGFNIKKHIIMLPPQKAPASIINVIMYGYFANSSQSATQHHLSVWVAWFYCPDNRTRQSAGEYYNVPCIIISLTMSKRN